MQTSPQSTPMPRRKTHDNEALLAEFRSKRCCEFCQRYLVYAAHPHHLWAKGMGCGSRMDVRFNLIALGGPWDCNCHGKVHQGKVTRPQLLDVVGRREGMTPEEIIVAVGRLKWGRT